MRKPFDEALDDLIREYLDAGYDHDEIITDLELKKMAMEEDPS